MTGLSLSLVLDIVILVLLGCTIVYAARLSLHLQRMRDAKGNLEKAVREFVKASERAEKAVSGMRENARDVGAKLQSAIDSAAALSDELQIMTESGNNLASRIEHLIDEARPVIAAAQTVSPSPLVRAAAAPAPEAQVPQATPAQDYAQHLRKLDTRMPYERQPVIPDAPATTRGGFAIRDPEVERGLNPLAESAEFEEDETSTSLYSQAERDLYRALHGKKGGSST